MSTANISDFLLKRHRLVRAGFVAQAVSLQSWCESNGVKRQNADKALKEKWKGPKATQLVVRILTDAGVEV